MQRARAHLSENARAYGLRPDPSDLRVVHSRDSLTAAHVRFQQTVNGVPVFGASVSVSLPKNGSFEPIVRSRYVSRTAAPAPVSQTPDAARARAAEHIGASLGATSEAAPPELVYFPAPGKSLRPAWQLTLRTTQPFGTWLVVVDAATGEVLLQHNLLRFDSGRVFDPNPAQGNPGNNPPAPHCDSSANAALMAGEYAVPDKTLLGLTGAQLKGPWVDMTAPGIIGAYKSAGLANDPIPPRDYIYACNDDRFEEVMAYYHLDRTQRKIQALGFTGPVAILNRPIPVHAHFMPDCNAFFDPTNRGLHFGDFDDDSFFEGGCASPPPHYDAGEDADLIVHEYGHAIQDDQVPGWAFGPYPAAEQAAAIGEGFSDFLAGVINNDPCIGEYVNFGETACGGFRGLRSLQNANVYPAGFNACPEVDLDFDTIPESEEPHCGGLVWGGALWDLVESLGGDQAARDLTLTLVLESHFYLDQTATFSEAAAAVCLVDKILNGGANVPTISATFSARGISTGSCNARDFPSYYIRVLHTWSGDLDIQIKVGANVNSPVCTINIGDPGFPGNIDHYYVEYDLVSPCSGFLPPSVTRPWWLEVQDFAPIDIGTIEDFQVLLAGGTRCYSTDPPVLIPDEGAKVYAKIDCTTKIQAPPTPSPAPTPGPTAFGNVDCATGINSVDALKVLRYSAGLTYSQTEPCENIGVDTLPNGELQGNIDCSDTVNAVDALKLLRFAAGLLVTQIGPEPDACPNIGS